MNRTGAIVRRDRAAGQRCIFIRRAADKQQKDAFPVHVQRAESLVLDKAREAKYTFVESNGPFEVIDVKCSLSDVAKLQIRRHSTLLCRH